MQSGEFLIKYHCTLISARRTLNVYDFDLMWSRLLFHGTKTILSGQSFGGLGDVPIGARGVKYMAPKVSVILPSFNRSASLGPACRSVLDQSFRDLELIVVDDASTEDIKSLLREIDDPRIYYIRRETNGGPAAARNTGLAMAQGRFIAFQDSDDLWLPGKLERQLALLEERPSEVGAVTGGKVLYGRDRNRHYGPGRVTYAPSAGAWLRLDEDQVRRSLIECRISLQNTLFRRDCYPTSAWFDETMKANEDWEFTLRLTQNAKIYEDPEPVVFSRISSDSISRDKRKRALSFVKILLKHKELYRNYPDEYGRFLFNLGIALYSIGKKKVGLRYILRSFGLRPLNLLRMPNLLARTISRLHPLAHA